MIILFHLSLRGGNIKRVRGYRRVPVRSDGAAGNPQRRRRLQVRRALPHLVGQRRRRLLEAGPDRGDGLPPHEHLHCRVRKLFFSLSPVQISLNFTASFAIDSQEFLKDLSKFGRHILTVAKSLQKPSEIHFLAASFERKTRRIVE